MEKVMTKSNHIRVSPEVTTVPAAPFLIGSNLLEVVIIIECLPRHFHDVHN